GRPEKAIVGRRAAAMVPDGAAVFLDVGTTIEACARELARRQGFVVFTNSMRAAMEFDPALHEVHVLGGRMAGRDGSLVGEGVVEMLRNVRLDVALIACSAVEEGGQVMDFDLSKIAVKRAAMAASNRSLLLATRSKFGRRALGTIGPVDRFDALVTED
ncbi:MAG TPA: DeoR/GlpR transcriptional regulator, partial [Citreicella sp.]|nr:DeoR/GlpR transcriptional regulator [Citreicella sp.]